MPTKAHEAHDAPENPTNRDLYDELTRMGTRLARIERHVTGDSEPSRGIVVRLDRVEQQGERSRWWIRAAGAAAVTAFVVACRDVFTKH